MVQRTLSFRVSVTTQMNRVWEQNGYTRQEADSPVPESSYRKETRQVFITWLNLIPSSANQWTILEGRSDVKPRMEGFWI